MYGSISELRCGACGSTFSHFVFTGDTDSATDGLCSASARGRREIVLIEPTDADWLAYVDRDVAPIEFKRSGGRIIALTPLSVRSA